jgi:UDP-glucose 4-epimerase
MRVVVVGATGNIGTSVLTALAGDPNIESIIGIARRRPNLAMEKVHWRQADITQSDLRPHFEGTDAVICLAWLIQPSHELDKLEQTNVAGSSRVFKAASEAGVSRLIYASSVGAYSPGPKDRSVDESWPTDGIESSFYSRHKVSVERILDQFEPSTALDVVRIRPALVFKREAATEIRRLFAGPLVPSPLVRREMIPFVPAHPQLRFQAVHSLDVGEAFRLALHSDAHGAFNIAAEPVLDGFSLAKLLSARPISIRRQVLRAGASASWRLHLQPSSAGWLDLAFGVPIMDTSRARTELGWKPRYGADQALLEVLDGIRENSGAATPPLDPTTSGRFRTNEFRTGVGAREAW